MYIIHVGYFMYGYIYMGKRILYFASLVGSSGKIVAWVRDISGTARHIVSYGDLVCIHGPSMRTAAQLSLPIICNVMYIHVRTHAG